MANPKRRHSNTRTAFRRAHDFLSPPSTTQCSNCGVTVLPHRVCSACGYYKGRQVLTIKTKEKKKK
ncbi:MAG: 50S ribosomal protein L32 [Candidatus Omnitrophota bacterium]|nr:50S ribosomal protein L32 [Candidatus Omnitrophota bacterium]